PRKGVSAAQWLPPPAPLSKVREKSIVPWIERLAGGSYSSARSSAAFCRNRKGEWYGGQPSSEASAIRPAAGSSRPENGAAGMVLAASIFPDRNAAGARGDARSRFG